jgi:hypothetical protein
MSTMQKRLVLLTLAATLLAGCASTVPLSREQVGRIGADTSPAELSSIVGKATVSVEYDFDSQARRYHARYLSLQTGTTQNMTMVCTPTCIPIWVTVPVLTEYVLVQEQPSLKLLGWGTIEELSKSADERVASLMPDLKKTHDQLTRKK